MKLSQQDTSKAKASRCNSGMQIEVCWGDKLTNTVLALTEVRSGPLSQKPIDVGSSAYVQLACSTEDVFKTADALKAAGANITREPGPVPEIGTKVMKVEDPDGWVFAFVDNTDFLSELCKAKQLEGPICKQG
jgi:hypothetical protein